jgi:hypothetical protein
VFVDPHHLDADPDADPDSTYHPHTDPDSIFLFEADPDADPDFYLMRMKIRIQVPKMMQIRIHNTAWNTS